MKIYLAGVDGYKIVCRRRLHSFVHSSVKDIDYDVEVGSDIVLDSGAFSAWSLGKPIKLQDYINFVHEHKSKFTWYANLDVIVDPSKSGKLTWENQCEMELQGLKPLPVFHFQEDWKWLKQLVDNYDHIALGGMVEVPNAQLYDWLDGAFSEYLTDDKGMPICKVHGFGWTAAKVVNRYPWWSADSSSWIKLSALGSIAVPYSKRAKGKYTFNFDRPPIQYNVFYPPQRNVNSVWSASVEARGAVEAFLAQHDLTLGESKIQWWPKDEELPEDATAVRITRAIGTGSGNDSKSEDDWKMQITHQRIETVIEPGVSNNLPMRRKACASYYEDMEKAFEWPCQFKNKQALKQWFFA